MIIHKDDSIFISNELPVSIGKLNVSVTEFMSYQYLPIKFPGFTTLTYEPRLDIFEPILHKINRDYVETYGLDSYIDSYIYVTAKHRRVSPECPINRPGYHIDGFGESNVVNYIWSNCFPTIFNKGIFDISYDDKQSLIDMESQALKENEETYDNYSVLRLNNHVIHKVAPVTSVQNRAFLKVTFSKCRYNLIGNSHNYLLKYDWKLKERGVERNVPSR